MEETTELGAVDDAQTFLLHFCKVNAICEVRTLEAQFGTCILLVHS